MPRNNDKSVRIFSLTQSRLLETLKFPIPMNHASISPDGKLLLAVGDRHTAFFYKRVRLPSALSDGVSSYARYEWHEIATLNLSLAGSGDSCFSTAFSPSGRTFISKASNSLSKMELERFFASQMACCDLLHALASGSEDCFEKLC